MYVKLLLTRWIWRLLIVVEKTSASRTGWQGEAPYRSYKGSSFTVGEYVLENQGIWCESTLPCLTVLSEREKIRCISDITLEVAYANCEM
jgi:hypothetical protein